LQELAGPGMAKRFEVALELGSVELCKTADSRVPHVSGCSGTSSR
jgi:hypothetical protein